MPQRLVTRADVEAELPGLTIEDDTEPNAAQVDQYLADIIGEVTAILLSADPGVTMPTSALSAEAVFVRRTILEGARWMVLRAKYALTSSSGQSADIAEARNAYNDRLRRLPQIASALVIIEEPTSPPVDADPDGPIIAGMKETGRMYESAEEWTERRLWRDLRNVRRAPWPY